MAALVQNSPSLPLSLGFPTPFSGLSCVFGHVSGVSSLRSLRQQQTNSTACCENNRRIFGAENTQPLSISSTQPYDMQSTTIKRIFLLRALSTFYPGQTGGRSQRWGTRPRLIVRPSLP
jgi:hypothetical protein